jgi:probable addiction module antidote protein
LPVERKGRRRLTLPKQKNSQKRQKQKFKTTLWDPVEHLTTPRSIAAYLNAAFEDGDPTLITVALGDVARARGMTRLAGQAGVTREALYKALSPAGDPRLSTFVGVMKALGIRIRPVAA